MTASNFIHLTLKIAASSHCNYVSYVLILFSHLLLIVASDLVLQKKQ